MMSAQGCVPCVSCYMLEDACCCKARPGWQRHALPAAFGYGKEKRGYGQPLPACTSGWTAILSHTTDDNPQLHGAAGTSDGSIPQGCSWAPRTCRFGPQELRRPVAVAACCQVQCTLPPGCCAACCTHAASIHLLITFRMHLRCTAHAAVHHSCSTVQSSQ